MIQVNKAENELIETVLRSKTPVDVSLPDDMPDARLMPTIRTLCSLINKTERFEDQSKQALGRCLAMMAKRPDLYRSMDYKTFGEWEEAEVIGKCGLKRASLWAIKRIEEHFPSLLPERYARIGITKLALLAKFCSQGGGSCESHFQKAEALTEEKLKEWAVGKGLLNEGEGDGFTIKIPTTREVSREWRAFLDEPFVAAKVGSKDPDKVLRSLIQDARSDPNWTEAKAEDDK